MIIKSTAVHVFIITAALASFIRLTKNRKAKKAALASVPGTIVNCLKHPLLIVQ